MAFQKGHQTWNKKDLDSCEIIGMYQKGIPIIKIAKEFDCSFVPIERILKENRIKIRPASFYIKGKTPHNKSNLDKEKVIDLYKEGFTLGEVAKKLDCSDTPIKRILKEQGVTIRDHGYYMKGKIPHNKLHLPEQEIIKLHNQDISGFQISKKFGCTHNVIHKILKKNNIKIRNRGFYIKGKPSLQRLIKNEQIVVDMYNQNISGMKIAEKFGCNDTVIYGILKRNGVKVKKLGFHLKGKPSPKKLHLPEQEVIAMYNQHLPGKVIAKKFGCSAPIIYMILKRNGIEIRNEGCYNEGENHPNWQGGKSFEPYDQNWTPAFRRAIRKRDNQICMLCGIHREKLNQTLHVHHINGNKKMSIPQNCISLCVKCHIGIVHKDDKNKEDRENWIKLLQGKLSKEYDYKYSEEGEIKLNFDTLKIR